MVMMVVLWCISAAGRLIRMPCALMSGITGVACGGSSLLTESLHRFFLLYLGNILSKLFGFIGIAFLWECLSTSPITSIGHNSLVSMLPLIVGVWSCWSGSSEWLLLCSISSMPLVLGGSVWAILALIPSEGRFCGKACIIWGHADTAVVCVCQPDCISLIRWSLKDIAECFVSSEVLW